MSQETSVGVVGAGVMGHGIAQVLVTAGYPTVCVDRSADALTKAKELVVEGRYGLRRGVERGKLTSDQMERALSLLTFSTELADVASADLVIEAVYEDLPLKMTLFRELDALAPPNTVFATNSSGLPVTNLAYATGRPEKVLGWHWASPVPVRPLAEIVVTPSTDPAAVDLVTRIAKECGKNPIVIKDNPFAWGYVTSRILVAAMREAERIVADGMATPEQVNQLMVDCCAWPAGPLAMTDRIMAGWE